MSFGFSVGDFFLVLQLANKIRKSFIDAPVQFRAISDEVKTLSTILRDLEDVLPERTLPPDVAQSLEEYVTNCGRLLKELCTLLAKYHGLHPDGSRLRRIWHRLKWEPDDIKDVRLRLSSNIALLNGISDLLSRHAVTKIQEGVDSLTRFHEDEEFLRITSWLSSMDTPTQHNDLSARRQKNTGGWFLSSPTYLDWLNSSSGTLFCPGLPGGGKTMITVSVIEDLWDKFETHPEVGVAFIYCSYKRQPEQTLENCLASLLKQLILKLDKMPPKILDSYIRHRNRMSRPKVDELTSLLHTVINNYEKIYLVVDALDEYSKAPGTLLRFLQEIIQLQSRRSINFLATSRPSLPETQRLFEGKPEIEIRAKEDDVRKVLENEMPGMPTCISGSAELQALVKEEIIKAVDGMFLLTRMHLNSLRDKLQRKHVINALKNMPRGEEALDAAYTEAIERINSQRPGCRDLARRVLTWVSCARRPLTTVELRHALAVELGEAELDEGNLPEIEDVLSFCEGLVIHEVKSNTIRLVHYTTQDFLDRVKKVQMPHAQEDLALVCIAYLSFDEFTVCSCSNDKEFEQRLERNVLLDYCARNWGYHVRDADNEDVDEAALKFLGDDLKRASAVQAQMVSQYHFGGYSSDVPLQVEAVHLAAQFGLTRIMIRLITTGQSPDPRDGFGRTPLSYAAEYGHLAIVKLLALRQDTDSNSADEQGRTPFSWAAGSGHIDIVKALLSFESVDVEVNREDSHLLSPLAWAARNGCLEVVKYLLSRNDVEKDTCDEGGQTPLSWAAYNGHLEILKLLAASPYININSKDSFSQTPLSWAARNGHLCVVSFLVDFPDVDGDSKDDGDRTALMWASIHGHLEIVKLLASRSNVNADTTDQHGQTPLSWAAREGHSDVVKFLIDRSDVKLQSVDRRGLTPLRWAAWNGYEAIVNAIASGRQGDAEIESKLFE